MTSTCLISTATKLVALGALSVCLLSGCAPSNDNPDGLTAPERAAATSNDQALPAPAQGRLQEQNKERQKMDAMRTQDAAKAAKSP